MEEDSKKKVPGKAKVGLKRIKKKPNLNISKANLKSVNTPKKFNFLNMSVQKQSLRANNRALARNLSNARLELRNLSAEHHELKIAYQHSIQQTSRLKRLVGIKDEDIEDEVQKRMQIQIKQMKSVLEELTENMFKSSLIINMLNGKFTSLSRQSTASSRTASLGNDSTVADGSQNRLSLTQRGTSGPRNKKQNAIMMDYLSRADEFSPPPFAESPPFHAEKANMSIIAEQSFLADDFTSYNPLLPVSENPREVENKRVKPAQRVLIGKKTQKSTKNVLGEEEKTVSVIADIAESISDKEAIDQNTIKEMSPIDKKMNNLPVDEIAASEDLELGILDISSDFSHLVSGSPISTGRKEETANKMGGNAVNKPLLDKDKTRRQAYVVGKERKQPDDIKKVTSKTIPKTSKLAKYKSGSKLDKDSSKVKSASTVKTQTTLNQEIPLPVSGYQGSFNPFKPMNVLLRSPPPCNIQNPGNEGSPAGPRVKINSTQFLSSLSSSVERSCKLVTLPSNDAVAEQSSFVDEHTVYFNSEMELTRVNDFGKLLQSSQFVSKLSPSVNMADQAEEKLNENSDLKGTSKGGKSNKNKDKMNANVPEKKEKTSKKEKVVEQQDILEEAAATVEMRNKKPGIFTFAVSRKEADGTRKAVPEKTNRARSKKVRNVTPEKEKDNEGDDRDMFNFGDRTPTVPLEKLLQSKSVYDMSMNESSIAPTSGYSNFKQTMRKDSDIKESNSEAQQQNEHIYTVALKDSSDEKKNLKSKGRSRSKSKSRGEAASDDEWVPERKARSRSRGRLNQEKTSLDQEIENKSESNLKKTEAEHNECHTYNVPLEDSPGAKKDITSKGRSRSKSNTRSKSKSRRADESDDEVVPERKARSRSRGRLGEKKTLSEQNANGDGKADCSEFEKGNNPSTISQTDFQLYDVPLKDSSEAKKELSSKDRSRSKSKSRRGEESDDEVVTERRSRSRGRLSEQKTLSGQNANGNGKADCTEFEIGNNPSTISQTDCQLYDVPLKDSSEAKKELSSKDRSRSKSNTRSKSKSRRGEESDDEVVTKREARSRSQGRLSEKKRSSGQNADGDVIPDCTKLKKGESSSTINHTDCQVYDVALKDSPEPKKESSSKDRSRSKSRTRSKSKSRQERDSDNEAEPERKSRSRSKKVYDQDLDECGIDNIGQSKHPRISREQEKEDDVHEEPLKDSPDVKSKAETRRTRSKSRTRSKAKPIVFSDSDDDVPVKPSMSLEKDLGEKSKSMEENKVNTTVEDKENETGKKVEEKCQKEKNENICTVPLKDVQVPPNVSRSRTRSNLVNDSDEEANVVTISRSRSKTSQHKDVEKQDRDVNDEKETHVDLTRKSARSRSSKSVNYTEDDLSRDSIVSTRKSVESVVENSNKKLKDEKDHKRECYISDSDIDDTGDSVDKQNTNTKDSTGSKIASLTYRVGLKDGFDSSKINKRSRSKRKSISSKVDDNSDEEVIEKVSSKSVKKTSNRKKIKDDLDSDSDFEFNIKEKETLKKKKSTKDKKFNSVTKGRSKSAKLNETFEIDDDELDAVLPDTSEPRKGVKTSECTERNNLKDTESSEVKNTAKTPKVGSSDTSKSGRKINQRTVTKSKRKEGEKLVKDVETKSKSSRALLLESERTEKDPSLRLSIKTPAVSKSAGSLKSSKSTAVSKSNRKRAVDSKDVEQTPRLKKDRQDSSEQKENNPSDWNSLEMLKKRLTMLSSKPSHLDSNGSNDVRKRSAGGVEKENLKDEDLEDGAKRSRRAKGPISYVQKALNVKMRQGDSALVATESKAKAQMLRLQLAKRMGVLKVVGGQEKT